MRATTSAALALALIPAAARADLVFPTDPAALGTGTITVARLGALTRADVLAYEIDGFTPANSSLALVAGASLFADAGQLSLVLTAARSVPALTFVDPTRTLVIYQGSIGADNLPVYTRNGTRLPYTGLTAVIPLTLVPEPASWATLGLGLAGIVMTPGRCRRSCGGSSRSRTPTTPSPRGTGSPCRRGSSSGSPGPTRSPGSGGTGPCRRACRGPIDP